MKTTPPSVSGHTATLISDAPEQAAWYPTYVLFVLSLTGLFASIDRTMAGVLLQPIKEEIGASDTSMGLLVGFTFTAFYVVLGVPIARWCDVGTRRSILAIGLGLWSILTVAFGMAQSFVQLALCRVGVAVGEATAYPAAYSLIGDYFPSAKRARAVAIFRAALSMGSIGGFIVAAWIAQNYGWRAAFVSLGFPGVIIALMLRFTVREPRRGGLDSQGVGQAPRSFSAALAEITRQPLLVVVALALAFGTLTPLGAWIGPFFLRVHGFSLLEMAVSMGMVGGAGSLVGTITGGALWTYLAQRGVSERWLPLFVAISYFLCVPFMLTILLHNNMSVIMPAYFFLAVCLTIGGAPMLALVLNRVSPNVRALATSLLMMVVTFADGGVGPVLVGALNDALEPFFGAHAVRYSLIISSASLLIAGSLMILAHRLLSRPGAYCHSEFNEGCTSANV